MDGENPDSTVPSSQDHGQPVSTGQYQHLHHDQSQSTQDGKPVTSTESTPRRWCLEQAWNEKVRMRNSATYLNFGSTMQEYSTENNSHILSKHDMGQVSHGNAGGELHLMDNQLQQQHKDSDLPQSNEETGEGLLSSTAYDSSNSGMVPQQAPLQHFRGMTTSQVMLRQLSLNSLKDELKAPSILDFDSFQREHELVEGDEANNKRPSRVFGAEIDLFADEAMMATETDLFAVHSDVMEEMLKKVPKQFASEEALLDTRTPTNAMAAGRGSRRAQELHRLMHDGVLTMRVPYGTVIDDLDTVERDYVLVAPGKGVVMSFSIDVVEDQALNRSKRFPIVNPIRYSGRKGKTAEANQDESQGDCGRETHLKHYNITPALLKRYLLSLILACSAEERSGQNQLCLPPCPLCKEDPAGETTENGAVAKSKSARVTSVRNEKGRDRLVAHLVNRHGLYIGSADGFVQVGMFVDYLGDVIGDRKCLYCSKAFQDEPKWKNHVRKKHHMRINPEHRQYDKFYLKSYADAVVLPVKDENRIALITGTQSSSSRAARHVDRNHSPPSRQVAAGRLRSPIAKEDEPKHVDPSLPELRHQGYEDATDDEDDSDEDNDDDDAQEDPWMVWDDDGLVDDPCECLFCCKTFRRAPECVDHMARVHNFDLSSLRRKKVKQVDSDGRPCREHRAERGTNGDNDCNEVTTTGLHTFYDCVKYINYMRHLASMRTCAFCKKTLPTEAAWEQHIREMKHQGLAAMLEGKEGDDGDTQNRKPPWQDDKFFMPRKPVEPLLSCIPDFSGDES